VWEREREKMRKEKILELARGMFGKNKNCNAIARTRVEKGLSHQFRDRKMKKRDARTLWIQQLNAGAREYDLPYNKLIHGLSQAKVGVNRKVLADLAVNEPLSFRALAEVAKVFW
jgi:large subunit ribosomal protein L20